MRPATIAEEPLASNELFAASGVNAPYFVSFFGRVR